MKWLAVCTLIGLAQFAQANRQVSVAELDRVLLAQRTAQAADAETAKLLEGLELTERLTPSALQRILSADSPGPQVRQAIDLLADTSAFLNPPPSELLPNKPAPDPARQRALLGEAVDFVAVTLQHLPDFVVTRKTQSFDNVSANLSQSGRLVVAALHPVDTASREIAYRNGREVMEKAGRGEARTRKAGLQTWGEFGPILATVIRDAVKGQIVWDHWETGESDKTVAVFRYSVPRRASHYRLNYCCTLNAWVLAPSDDYRDTPAYHGALALDAASGAIRRITVEADIGGTEVVERADIAVEYGNADIGGRSYICPLRGLALSVDRYHPGMSLQNPITRINEVRFVNYHKFGSTARILPGDAIASSEEQGVPREEGSASPSAGVTDLGESSIAAPAAAPLREGAPNATQHPSPSGQDRIGSEEHAPVIQTPVFKTQTQNVLVDVVVTQKNGDSVLNLSRDDFAIREDGSAEKIAFFEEHRAASGSAHSAGAPQHAQANDSTDSVNVILLDLLNTSPQSQVLVREKLNAFFKKMAPDQRVALFALGSNLRCVQGLTTDASMLTGALNDKKNGIFPGKIGAGWHRDDEMEKEAEIARLKKVGIQSTQAVREALERLAAAQRQKQIAMTLEAIDDLAQLLGSIPGRKNLLWFAETFPVQLSPVLRSGGDAASPNRSATSGETMVQEYADKVREVSHKVTAARIAVYPIQAEGMMEEHIFEANLASPGSEEENLSIRRANSGSAAKEGQDLDLTHSHKAGSQERADTMTTMEQLAAETGGKAFFNTNALDTAAARAVAHGASYYTLGYSPTNGKMDGQYRRIEVTVRGKYGLSYRRGYFADSKPAKTADTESGKKSVPPASR